MHVLIRSHLGPNTYAPGTMDIGGEQFQIVTAHFWQRASWFIKRRPTTEIVFTAKSKRPFFHAVCDSEDVAIAEIWQRDEGLLELTVHNEPFRIQRIASTSLINLFESWAIFSGEEQLGNLKYRDMFVKLKGDIVADSTLLPMLVGACIWTVNREST